MKWFSQGRQKWITKPHCPLTFSVILTKWRHTHTHTSFKVTSPCSRTSDLCSLQCDCCTVLTEEQPTVYHGQLEKTHYMLKRTEKSWDDREGFIDGCGQTEDMVFLSYNQAIEWSTELTRLFYTLKQTCSVSLVTMYHSSLFQTLPVTRIMSRTFAVSVLRLWNTQSSALVQVFRLIIF